MARVMILLVAAGGGSAGELPAVDAHPAPPWGMATIGMADYWLRSFVGRDGGLRYRSPGPFDGYGIKITAGPDDKGLAKIARTWARGDEVELEFPMEPRVVRGHETELPSANRKYFAFEPPGVFEPRRLPYASVLCGPLRFALPIPDVEPNTPVNDATWQYALGSDAGRGDAGLTVERRAMPAHRDWPLDALVVLVLKVPVQAFDWKRSDAQALPEQPVTGTASETVRLVPCGCTKFRISMFPVTSRAWSRDPP